MSPTLLVYSFVCLLVSARTVACNTTTVQPVNSIIWAFIYVPSLSFSSFTDTVNQDRHHQRPPTSEFQVVCQPRPLCHVFLTQINVSFFLTNNAQADYLKVICNASRTNSSTATCSLGDSVRNITILPWGTVSQHYLEP